MIPDGWRKSTLRVESEQLQTGPFGSQLKAEEYLPRGEVAVVMPKEIVDGKVVYKNSAHISNVTASKLRKHRLQLGDVVFSRRGDVARTAVIQDASVVAICGTGCLKATLKQPNCMEFYSHYLQSPDIGEWLTQNAVGQTLLNLNTTIIGNLPLTLPPLPEQQKIAEILSTWDRAIAVQEKLVANARAQKEALMQKLLTAKKRLPGFEGKWTRLTFDSVFRIANEKGNQVQTSKYQTSGRTPIVDQSQQFIAGYTDSLNIYQHVPVIVFGDHTRALKWIDFMFCPGADGTQLLKAAEEIDLRFGYFLLEHAEIPSLGYSRHMKQLKELVFLVPSQLREQEEIAYVLSNCESEIERQEKLTVNMRQEKSALMQQLLTGKRRVKLDTVP